jgi:LacI family transcriptional regulator
MVSVTLEDIARIAGVSKSTVSRVMNDDPHVGKRTREHVLQVAREHNYVPNHAAQTLVKKRSDVIGVVIPGTAHVFFGDNSYFPMLLQGIADSTNELDLAMLLWLGQNHPDREQFSRRILQNSMCDGLIIASIWDNDSLFDRLVTSVPYFVMVECPLRYQDTISYVTIDNVASGRMATEHLISLGYRRIAHITGNMLISDGQDRLLGYRQALEAAGLPYDPDLVYEGDFTYNTGYSGMEALLPIQPDGVFVASDNSALGAVQAIEDAGLRVPDDIAIVGFDDLDVATKFTPYLTTVHQPIQAKGAAAVNLLVDLITGKVTGPQKVILPTQLVIRQSCGAKL